MAATATTMASRNDDGNGHCVVTQIKLSRNNTITTTTTTNIISLYSNTKATTVINAR